VNLTKLYAAVEDAAGDDPAAANRVIVIYLPPGDAGLYLHRVRIGSHLLGGGGPDADFAASMMAAVEKLWPESTPKLRNWLRVAADMISKSPLARMLLGQRRDDDE
jgi:hypothetical protein